MSPRPLLAVLVLATSCTRESTPATIVAAGAPVASDSSVEVSGGVQLAPGHHDEDFQRAYMAFGPRETKHHDPLTLVALDANLAFTVGWPEHPAGEIRRATNNLGFNEDEPTLPEKRGLRVLVAGDSHTEGVVSNDESFPNVLERSLRESGRPGAEVLNAGVGYMGPHCYLGVLRKHVDLAPDVFVATVFAGNDFMDDLRVLYLEKRAVKPPAGDDYYGPLNEVLEERPAACWQGVNQIHRFASFPEEAARALDRVEESFAAMQELCVARGIVLLAVVLPTKYDVDVEERATEFEGVAETLGLTAEDMDANARLGAELVRRLERRGIPCLAALQPFLDETEPLYWRADHHLNVRGHAKLAELLLAKLTAELLPTR